MSKKDVLRDMRIRELDLLGAWFASGSLHEVLGDARLRAGHSLAQ